MKSNFLASLLRSPHAPFNETADTKTIVSEKDSTGDSTTPNTPGADAQKIVGGGNVYVSSQRAAEMIAFFKRTYPFLNHKEREMIETALVDSVLIIALHELFEATSDQYNGVRFYFGATNDGGLKYTSNFIMVPTTPGHPEPANAWGKLIIPSTEPKFRGFDLEREVALPQIKNFRMKFREQVSEHDMYSAKNNALTSAVWIDRAVIKIMFDFLEKNVFDGFSIHVAAYDKDPYVLPRGARENGEQTTILLVPTKNAVDDWDILVPNKDKAFFNALNHGELCPDNCPPIDEE